MNEKDYNSAEGIRRSDLWLMNDSAEKFKWHMDNPEEEKTPALLFGSACHKWVLEQDGFADEYAVAPKVDRRTKDGREAWARFEEENAGKTIVTQDDFDTMKAMREVLCGNALASNLLFGNGETETPFFWTDPDTDEKCKVKCDRIVQDGNRLIVVDYKTAGSARTDDFNRSVLNFGYSLQAAMYTEAILSCRNLEKRPRFVFVVQEKKAPYSVNVIEVDYEVMQYGLTQYRELLNKYHACRELDMWEGYNAGNEINQTTLPKWAMNQEEEDE